MKELYRKQITNAYYKFLISVDWSDELLVSGIREELNKFISNGLISLVGKTEKNKKHKYRQVDFYSEAAILKVRNGDFTNLVHEHIAPKSRYIQKPCEEATKVGKLSTDFIDDLLKRYWRIAVITKDEDNQLPTFSMSKTSA